MIVDRSFHRAFAVQWPSVAVHASWLWKPLAVDGPKLVTTVFEPVPPSTGGPPTRLASLDRQPQQRVGRRRSVTATSG